MIKKHCPKCKKYSFSASANGKWICPTCGYDLTFKPVLQLGYTDIKEGLKQKKLILLDGKSS